MTCVTTFSFQGSKQKFGLCTLGEFYYMCFTLTNQQHITTTDGTKSHGNSLNCHGKVMELYYQISVGTLLWTLKPLQKSEGMLHPWAQKNPQHYCGKKTRRTSLGLCKEKIIQKIRDYYGSGWVSPGAKIIKKNTKLDSKQTSNVPC